MSASRLVRLLFALPRRKRLLPLLPAAVLDYAMPTPGQITLITGPSGGGKSRLLRALRDRPAPPGGPGVLWLDPATLPLGQACVVDRVCDELEGGDPQRRVEIALELLSRVGLAEAWTYLQTPAELSDGQRWRLMLALTVARAVTGAAGSLTVPVLAADEFAALLDRVTARVVARALRRLVDRQSDPVAGPRLAAVVATSHGDLIAALSPDRVVVADFGEYRCEAT